MITGCENLVMENFKNSHCSEGRGPLSGRKSHHLLFAAVAGAAGVAGQPALAAGETAARPIRTQSGTPLLEDREDNNISLAQNNRWQQKSDQ